MNRPQIVNPVTKKIMNVFSEEFESLLDQGFTIKQLLDMPLLKPSPNIPLTGNMDIDRQLIINLPLYELKKLCEVNKYTRSLCQVKEFWLDKMKMNGLTLPEIKIKNIDWLRLYDVLLTTTEILEVEDEYNFIMNDSFQVADLLKLLKMSNLDIPEDTDLPSNDEPVQFINFLFDKNNFKIILTFRTLNVTKSQMLLFILYIYYYNLYSGYQ